MPKVSVIIPVYNVEKYLRECLDSVVDQTLGDIEIICINDGSTDNSLSILTEYAQNDSRIKIINQNNKGVAAARNLSIKESNGEFVCFLDSDDYYPANDILEILYKKAVENGVLICGGEFAKFTNDDPVLKQKFPITRRGFLFEKEGFIRYIDYQYDCGFVRFIYNREFLIKNNIYFPNYRRFEDPPFMVKAMIEADLLYVVHKIVYAYRVKYKVNNWTEKIIIDTFKGIMDNFIYAHCYNLNMLEDYSYARLKFYLKSFRNKRYISKYFMLIKYFLYLPYVRKRWIKSFFKNIFSVGNSKDRKHKIITILGIKIKVKRKKKEK